MELTLSDLRELLGSTNQPRDFGSPYKIVVLDKGFVVVGRVVRDGSYIVVQECRCIRYWGTPQQDNESGLGYLARNGPTPKTKLDSQPCTRVHELQVVQLIDASEDKWYAS